MKKRNKRNLYIFGIVVFIFILLLVFILPKCLYGRNLLSYYIQSSDKYGSLYGSFNNLDIMPKSLNYKFIIGRTVSFFIFIFYLIFFFWIKKNIKGNRKVIYPVMYLVFLFLIYFSYLSYVKIWLFSASLDILLAPVNNLLLSNIFCKIIFVPFNPLNFIFIILVKIGDIIDKEKLISNYKLLYIEIIICLIQCLFLLTLSSLY